MLCCVAWCVVRGPKMQLTVNESDYRRAGDYRRNGGGGGRAANRVGGATTLAAKQQAVVRVPAALELSEEARQEMLLELNKKGWLTDAELAARQAADRPALSWRTKRAWGLMCLMQLSMALTQTMTWPLMPFIEFEFFNHGNPCVTINETDSEGCQHAMALDSKYSGFFFVFSAVCTIVVAPVAGKLSDAYGRKKLLILGQILLWSPWLCLYLWSTPMHLTLWGYFLGAKGSCVPGVVGPLFGACTRTVSSAFDSCKTSDKRCLQMSRTFSRRSGAR